MTESNIDLMFRLALGYLTQKLLGPLIKTEKLGRNRFELVPVYKKETKELDNSKIIIMFHYALLTEAAIKRLNKHIERAQNVGASRIVVLSYYSTPEMTTKISSQENISSYILMNSTQLNDMKTEILREDAPSQSEYETSVKEQLSFITY